MKRKNIIGLIAIVAVVVVAMFAGCVEEETPVSAPTPTATPSQKITPTPTPAPSPIETPIPTPTLIPTQEVEEDKSPVILKVTSSNIKKEYSYYELTGTIKNEGTAIAESVKVTIKLYDKDGHLIGSGYTYTDLSEIQPNEESTFSKLIEIISDTLCENYEIIPTYSRYRPTATLAPSPTETPVILKVTSSNIKKEYSYYELTGTIKNEGTATAESVKVTIKLYDKDRRLIGSGYTYTHLSEIPPNEESTFSKLIEIISDTPCENYEIIPTYSRYS